MNKEAEMHLSELPRLNKPRSTFPYNQSIKGSMKVGKLYPIQVIEMNPGDTLTLDLSHLTRAMTQIVPVMDNSYLDVQVFTVAPRTIYKHWEEFWGENKTGAYAQQTEYETPQIKFPETGFASGSLADCLGLPVYRGTDKDTVNRMPIDGYIKIWNDWYRDENLQDPIYFHDDDTVIQGKNYDPDNWDEVTDTETGGALLSVCRFHDYFSSCLPDLQRGPSINIPLGKNAAVMGNGMALGLTNGTRNSGLSEATNGAIGNMQGYYGKDVGTYPGDVFLTGESALGVTEDPTKSGLIADLSNAIGTSITVLRQCIAVQHFYEQLNRGGGRYIEYLSTIWGTEAKDETLQRSVYHGGRRFPINIDQVLQTSSTDIVSPQGNTAAFSCTCNETDLCTISTTEHQYCYIMACIRTSHSYCQGIPRMFSRKKWTDFYIPTFDGLSDMAVLNKEIYFQGNANAEDDEVFGYQESFADYRIQVDRVFGQLRQESKDSQGNSNTLSVWTYQDYYESKPMLNAEWIKEDGNNFKRTISLQEDEYDQFQVDFYLKGKFSRVMPTYGIPGISYI